jgi:hypothetical protein
LADSVKRLDEASLAPQRGDGGVLLFLRSSETGYRGRAIVVAPDGRPLREGVRVSSTCPVAATQDLYLSCTSAGWEMGAIAVAPDSEFRLDEIMKGGQPIQPMNWGADHRNVLDIISNSFGVPQRLLPPPTTEAPPVESPRARPAQRAPERPAPAPRAPERPAAQRAPERPPVAQRAPERPPAAQRAPERLPAAQRLPAPQEPARERRSSSAREGQEARPQPPQGRPLKPELDEEAQAAMLTLAAAARELKRGVPASEVMSSLADTLADRLIQDDEVFLEDPEDPEDDEGADGDDEDDEDLDDEGTDEDGDLYGDDEDADEDLDEDDEDVEDEDLDEDLDEDGEDTEDEDLNDDDVEDDLGSAPVTAFRPLQIGEIPPGLKADEVAQFMAYSDPAAEDKMRRTQERASAAIQRARMIGALQEQERQRALAAQAEVQPEPPPQPARAPKAPRAPRAPQVSEPEQTPPADTRVEPIATEGLLAGLQLIELDAQAQLPEPVRFKGQAWYTLEQVAGAAGVSVATARNRVRAANISTMRASIQKGPGAPKILIPAEAVRLRAP